MRHTQHFCPWCNREIYKHRSLPLVGRCARCGKKCRLVGGVYRKVLVTFEGNRVVLVVEE